MIVPLAARLPLIIALIDETGIVTPVVAIVGADTVKVGVALDAATVVLIADGQGVFAALSFVSAANAAYHQ